MSGPTDLDEVAARLTERLGDRVRLDAVPYTHLTLPTSDLVEISGVAVSLKKKKLRSGE